MNRNSSHNERLRAIMRSFPNITVAVLADPAAGADTESAARLAGFAFGIVMTKQGTATVSQAELLNALADVTAHGK